MGDLEDSLKNLVKSVELDKDILEYMKTDSELDKLRNYKGFKRMFIQD